MKFFIKLFHPYLIAYLIWFGCFLVIFYGMTPYPCFFRLEFLGKFEGGVIINLFLTVVFGGGVLLLKGILDYSEFRDRFLKK